MQTEKDVIFQGPNVQPRFSYMVPPEGQTITDNDFFSAAGLL